jgi:hypothetical protein
MLGVLKKSQACQDVQVFPGAHAVGPLLIFDWAADMILTVRGYIPCCPDKALFKRPSSPVITTLNLKQSTLYRIIFLAIGLFTSFHPETVLFTNARKICRSGGFNIKNVPGITLEEEHE